MELFNVRTVNGNKIVAGPFENKADAKRARNALDPEAAAMDVAARSANFGAVVTYGKDHHAFGRKNKKTQVGGGKKADATVKKAKAKK